MYWTSHTGGLLEILFLTHARKTKSLNNAYIIRRHWSRLMRCGELLTHSITRYTSMLGRFGASFKTSVEIENEGVLLGGDGMLRHARQILCTRRSILGLLLCYLALYMILSSAFCDNNGVCLVISPVVYPSTEDAEMQCVTLNITMTGLLREGTFHYADAAAVVAETTINLNVVIWRLTRTTECTFRQQDDTDDDKKRRFTYSTDYPNTSDVNTDRLLSELLAQYPLNASAYTAWYYAVGDNWCSYFMRDQTDVNCLASKPIDTSDFSMSFVDVFLLWLCVCLMAALFLFMMWLIGFMSYRAYLSGAYTHHHYYRGTGARNIHEDGDGFSEV